MLNENDPFKFKIDSRVSHPRFGSGKVTNHETKFKTDATLRLCWVIFDDRRHEVVSQDELTAI